MSETTNLKLKKHDEPLNENTNQFNVRDYLNGNWDKIEDFAEQVNDKVIEIEDSIDLVKQRTEQAVEDINTDIENIKQEQTEQNTNIQKNTTDILNLDTTKASKSELQEATIALQAELLKAQEEIERQNKDYKAGTLEGQEEGESLYLQDSSDARFREFGIGGNSEQEKREGYNKFDIQKWLDNDLNVAHGTLNSKNKDKISLTASEAGDCFTNTYAMTSNVSNNQQLIDKFGIEVKPSTAYTIYLDKNNTEKDSLYVFFCDAEYNYISLKNKMSVDNYNILNFAIPENAKYLTARIGVFDAGKTIEFSNIMLLEGTYTKETLPKYEQYGAMPSLEFPSEIQAVGQDVNLFDKDSVEFYNNNLDTFSNTANSNTTRVRTSSFEIEGGETYTLSGLTGKTTLLSVRPYGENEKIVSTGVSRVENTFTLTKEVKYIHLLFKNNDDSELNREDVKAMPIKLQKGAEATAYSPYGCGSANITVCNKNFFDKNAVVWEAGKRVNSSTGKLESNSFEWASTQNYIPVPSNTTLHFKGTVCYVSWRFYMHTYNANKQFIKTIELNSGSETRELTFNTEEAKFVRFTFNVSKINWDSIQLEIGETATDYIAHEEQTLTMPIQQEMLEGDKFEKVNGVWKEKHTWNSIAFTDNKTGWFKSGVTKTNAYGRENVITGLPILTEETSKCTHFKYSDNTTSPFSYASRSDNIYLCFPLGTAETLEEFKSLMQEQTDAGTPVRVYYKLAEPYYLDCTSEQIKVLDEIEKTLHSYKGGTHVYSVDELSPIFNTRYTVDMQTAFNAINKGVINNV